jgi:hypothetical protein
VQSNFNDYRMVRINDAPDIVTALALTGGKDKQGKLKWSAAPIAGHRQRHLRGHRKMHPLAAVQESEAHGIGESSNLSRSLKDLADQS